MSTEHQEGASDVESESESDMSSRSSQSPSTSPPPMKRGLLRDSSSSGSEQSDEDEQKPQENGYLRVIFKEVKKEVEEEEEEADVKLIRVDEGNERRQKFKRFLNESAKDPPAMCPKLVLQYLNDCKKYALENNKTWPN
ncbi:unnamed protein product [Caenorhabditis sp. 36 PRJEB53466]|nr:unnamed protein product [Caenorhabditis sp. 36 PRJEB53466]